MLKLQRQTHKVLYNYNQKTLKLVTTFLYIYKIIYHYHLYSSLAETPQKHGVIKQLKMTKLSNAAANILHYISRILIHIVLNISETNFELSRWLDRSTRHVQDRCRPWKPRFGAVTALSSTRISLANCHLQNLLFSLSKT